MQRLIKPPNRCHRNLLRTSKRTLSNTPRNSRQRIRIPTNGNRITNHNLKAFRLQLAAYHLGDGALASLVVYIRITQFIDR